MKRRTFLKLAGMGSVSFALGCGAESDKTLFSLVKAPDDMVTGRANFYASTCRECPAGCGILVKNREGRAIKIEGNPLHPINRGKLCMRGQAALQGVYHPDRLKGPLLKDQGQWRNISFEKAQTLLTQKIQTAAGNGTDRIQLLTELVGESLSSLFKTAMAAWRSDEPVVFEPLACDAQKTANYYCFGDKCLPKYQIKDTDCLLSFGADFLETWLSPVSYAHQFKMMHGVRGHEKGRFFHIGPYQSLTAANADQWIACRPGTEHYLALGLIHEMLARGKGKRLSKEFVDALSEAVAGYTSVKVANGAGIFSGPYEGLVQGLLNAKTPLVIGTGASPHGANALQVNLAVNILNYIIDPKLSRFDFDNGHRLSAAASRTEIISFFDRLTAKSTEVLLLNQVNPVYALPPKLGVDKALKNPDLFVVCFSNVLDETAQHADLVIPVRHALESWDEYSGVNKSISTLQPTMAPLTNAPQVGDVVINALFPKDRPGDTYKAYLMKQLGTHREVKGEAGWIQAFQKGGVFSEIKRSKSAGPAYRHLNTMLGPVLEMIRHTPETVPAKDGSPGLILMAMPSIRFFDGRSGDKPWLCEIPDPLSKVAWQTPVWIHPETLKQFGAAHESVLRLETEWGALEAVAYETEGVHPEVAVMAMGQGHQQSGRYSAGIGLNPLTLMSPTPIPSTNQLMAAAYPMMIKDTGRKGELAHTDGSRIQHGRKIALSVALSEVEHKEHSSGHGLTMNDFPLTLPLPEGYDPKRDFYPSHDHDTYRWGMVVDLDRCIGCGACAAACYAENNVGIVGEDRILEGREMAWLRVERYLDPHQPEKVTFLPMMCQHCDNAPCEAVCPVYAPHHSKEGLNNQIYNRCIGTRFCSQNCPYKVRRFNWFDWQWPDPLPQQLNPNVTVRTKGVMEKCSFCIQRIKVAHGKAKDESRKIRDGEIVPACVQTCPTDALTFGDMMDVKSRVRQLAKEPRAYQVMGYLNTKPAVIYLKKVVQI